MLLWFPTPVYKWFTQFPCQVYKFADAQFRVRCQVRYGYHMKNMSDMVWKMLSQTALHKVNVNVSVYPVSDNNHARSVKNIYLLD